MKKINSTGNAVFLLSLIAIIIGLVGCASIMSGSKQEVSISSEPENAKIFVNGNQIGTTPSKILLKRGEKHIIEIRANGYETYRISTSKTITGWFWGNLICGGLIGFVIDLATGNAYDVDPSKIDVILEKGSGATNIYQMENFGSINIYDENNNHIGTVDVLWE